MTNQEMRIKFWAAALNASMNNTQTMDTITIMAAKGVGHQEDLLAIQVADVADALFNEWVKRNPRPIDKPEVVKEPKEIKKDKKKKND